MIATENLTVTGKQPKSFEELICSPSFADGLKQHASYLSTVNFLLSLTAFLGNSLILVALHKESSLHPPSKLLYRCLATTDLLIGLATQPLYTIHWISLVREDWVLCRFAFDAARILGYQLGIVSLLTLTAIGVDRILALLLGLLWVQLALVVCYVPYSVVAILIASSEIYSSQLIVSSRIVLVFVFFNSSLNPFLYCWKISEVRQAVIETIRQALCCPCS